MQGGVSDARLNGLTEGDEGEWGRRSLPKRPLLLLVLRVRLLLNLLSPLNL